MNFLFKVVIAAVFAVVSHSTPLPENPPRDILAPLTGLTNALTNAVSGLPNLANGLIGGVGKLGVNASAQANASASAGTPPNPLKPLTDTLGGLTGTLKPLLNISGTLNLPPLPLKPLTDAVGGLGNLLPIGKPAGNNTGPAVPNLVKPLTDSLNSQISWLLGSLLANPALNLTTPGSPPPNSPLKPMTDAFNNLVDALIAALPPNPLANLPTLQGLVAGLSGALPIT